ncbi:c-type cytochrome [Alcaligenes sp. AB3]|uniref:c-type cytochrome n=1 Tax=Alcaligenes TaxID=507 RepID=UPI0007C476BB|nr:MULTISPECIES: c-type cytochrome [Alcaligenes]MDT0219158.1 c-type cytochrome [Alcaligenes sp. AB3]
MLHSVSWASCLPLVVFCGLLSFNPAAKADTVALMDIVQAQCLSCHQIDRKRVGPPFREIAQRYAPGPAQETRTYLQRQIQQGSRGNWGAIPMPAQNRINAEQAQAIAAWLLSLANSSTKENS